MNHRLQKWETVGAAAGIAGPASLAIGYLIAYSAAAPLRGPDAEYSRVLLGERMKWEWITLMRLVGGTLVIWFAALLGDRLRLAEREPARLAETAFGLGVVWAGVWLLSAFFNSASIRLAADYSDPAGSRIAGILAAEIPAVLTAAVMFTLLLATALVAFRSATFPRPYGYTTAALAAVLFVLALIDWYGTASIGWSIIALALAWTAATSVMFLRAA